MADCKGSELKEEHIKGKTKSCQPRRKTSEVERTFQEYTHKDSGNYCETDTKNH